MAATFALDLSSAASHGGPLAAMPAIMNYHSLAAAYAAVPPPPPSPPEDPADEGVSTDDSGSTFGQDSSPPTPTREGEMDELGGGMEFNTLAPMEPITEEQMQHFREEYNRQVMLRFGDSSSSKCFTRNAACKVVKVMLGEEVDTKWVARSKERGLMLGNGLRPFTEEETKHVTSAQVCLWKQLIGDDGNPVLDANGQIMVRKVALVEEFFDYINNLHFGEMKYVGEKSVFKRIREICACLPRQAINIYKKHCPHCQRSSRAISSREKLAKKKKMKENEESPFNGLSMVPMKRAFGSVGPEEGAKVPKLENEEPVPVNPDRIKAAGIFIRHLVEDRLQSEKIFNDQPKEQISYIIAAVGRQFPELSPQDVKGRIRSHLKSIRRSSRKNGGCNERRRSLPSMCGSTAVLDIFDRAVTSEEKIKVQRDATAPVEPLVEVCRENNRDNSTKVTAEPKVEANNPDENKPASPDLPTDLSLRKCIHEEVRQDVLTTIKDTTNKESHFATSTAVSVAGVSEPSHCSTTIQSEAPTGLDYVNHSEFIRGEVNQMYLTSLLLPMLMNQLPQCNSTMTPHELMERWVAQIRSSALGVLTAVECYEQYMTQYRERNQRQ